MTSLRLSAVSVRVGTRTLLAEASHELRLGEFLALVGPNGRWEKPRCSTRTPLGFSKVTSGSVTVAGVALEKLTPRARAAELAWLPQQSAPTDPLPARRDGHGRALSLPRKTTARNAACRGAPRASSAASASGRARRPLGSPSSPAANGSGHRDRGTFDPRSALPVARRAHANHLDPAQQNETYALLGRLCESGTGILCVTHDVNLLNHVGGAPKVAGLRDAALRFELEHQSPELPSRLSELFGVHMLALSAAGARVIVPSPPAAGERAS